MGVHLDGKNLGSLLASLPISFCAEEGSLLLTQQSQSEFCWLRSYDLQVAGFLGVGVVFHILSP